MYCQDEHNNKKHPLASKDEKRGGGGGPSAIDAGRDLMDPMALNRGRGP